MYGEVGQVEEQRLALVVVRDDLDRLGGEDVSGVVAIVLPGHIHSPPEVVAPTSLQQGLKVGFNIARKGSTDGYLTCYDLYGLGSPPCLASILCGTCK